MQDVPATHPSFHARETPGKIAYRMAGSGKTLSYAELDQQSNQGAHVFRASGLTPGCQVVLLMENCLDFLVVCWSAQRSGLYYTPISTHLKSDEIGHIVADSGATVLVISPCMVEKIGSQTLRALGIEVYVSGRGADGFDSWAAALAVRPTTPIADEIGGADMLYSSGTLGRPKGVKQVLANNPITALNPLMKVLMVDMLGMSAASTYLSTTPLYHAAPLRFAMITAALGGTSVIMEKFDAETSLALIQQYAVTHVQMVPTLFVRLLKLPEERRNHYDASSLRAVIHAASPCPADIKERMIDWWGPILTEYYAGTEANGVTIIHTPEWITHRGSVGRAAVGTLKIVDDLAGAEVPTGSVGSVFFADGPRFAYHNDPRKTEAAYNDRGWSTLGDMGFLDDEGFLYLTDRKAYMIISGGVNVYPQETEDVLIIHPAVADVAVFGIPNAEMGEEVKAVVQLTDPALAGPSLAAELVAFCRSRLSAIKSPSSVDFVDELPRTPTGKLIKRRLRDPYWPATPSA